MRQSLESTLQELHVQLAEAENLDDNQISQLRAAVKEIEETLDRSDVNSYSLARQLQQATENFSGSHPVLTATIGRVADLLSQMGI